MAAEYTIAGPGAVVTLELAVLRTGLFRLGRSWAAVAVALVTLTLLLWCWRQRRQCDDA